MGLCLYLLNISTHRMEQGRIGTSCPHSNLILFIQNKMIKIKHDGVGMRNSHTCPIFTFFYCKN